MKSSNQLYIMNNIYNHKDKKQYLYNANFIVSKYAFSLQINNNFTLNHLCLVFVFY